MSVPVWRRVAEAIDGKRRFKLKLGKVGFFPGEEYDVVYAEVESDGVEDLHERVSALPHRKSDFPFYKAHCTIAYVKPGMGPIYALRFGSINLTCEIDSVIFSDVDHTKHVIPLGRLAPVNKAAMSYLATGSGGALVAPAGGHAKRRPIKLKRKRRMMRMCKAALLEVAGDSDDFLFPNGEFDAESFVFGKSTSGTDDDEPEYEPEYTKATGTASMPAPGLKKPAAPKPVAAPQAAPTATPAPAPAAAPVPAPTAEATPAPTAPASASAPPSAPAPPPAPTHPAFKQWFGNSQVVHAPAEPAPSPASAEPAPPSAAPAPAPAPKVIYHGNPRGVISEFKKEWTQKRPEQMHYGGGFYFTEDPVSAEMYANGATGSAAKGAPGVGAYHMRAEKPFDADTGKIDPNQLPAIDRQSVRTNLIQRALAEEGRSAALEVGRQFDAGKLRFGYRELSDTAGVGGMGASKEGLNQLLKSQGHDAITVQGPDAPGGAPGANRFWVGFEPHQIKPVNHDWDPKPNAEELAAGKLGPHLHSNVQLRTTPSGGWVVKGRNGKLPAVQNEVVASTLAKSIGLNVPQVHHVQLNGQDQAVVRHVPGAALVNMSPEQQREALAKVPKADIDQHALFDYLIGSGDPNSGNYIVTPEHRLVGIDKENSLSHGDTKSSAHYHIPFFLEHAVPQGQPAGAYQFDPNHVVHMAGAGAEMAEQLRKMGRTTDAMGVERRTAVLKNLAESGKPVSAVALDQTGRAYDKSAPPTGFWNKIKSTFGWNRR